MCPIRRLRTYTRLLDLVSRHLPDIEIIICADKGYNARFSDAEPSSFTFNLAAFEKLKSFRINIESVVPYIYGKKTAFDYLLPHFKYANGEEAFYYVHGEDECSYQLTATNQQFMLDCLENEELSTKLLTFEYNDKIEEFLLFYDRYHIGELRFGEIVTAPPKPVRASELFGF